MRILLDQCVHDLRNVGNNAMLEIAMERLGAFWPDATFEIITLGSQLLRLYYPNTIPVNPNMHSINNNRKRLEKIYQIMPRSVLRLLLELRERAWHRWVELSQTSERSTAKLLIPSKMKFNEDIMNSNTQTNITDSNDFEIIHGVDLLVATGGNYLSDTVKDGAFRILDRLEIASRSGIPTVMVGQGVGPIEDSMLRARAKQVLPLVNLIFVREKLIAPDMLETFGVDPSRIFITGDDAIELAYNFRKPRLGTAIGVNIRVAHYTEVEIHHLEIIRETIQQAGKKFGAQLVALPISQNNIEADSKAILKLFTGYQNTLNSWRNFETPLEIIDRVSLCRLVVTGGYHPAVFALAQGIPVVSLAKSTHYVNKLRGVADQFGTGCEIVYLNDEHFREKLVNAIDIAWQSAEQIRPQLLEASVRQINQGRMAYKRIYDLVDSANYKKQVVEG